MIILKTSKNIDKIRKSCKIVAYVLSVLENEIKPGITTLYLNELAENICQQKGGIPGFKGYNNFPYSICSSVNEEVVHGFPSKRKLKDGDIISIDFGAIYKGWYGDSAFTKQVGKVSEKTNKLIKTGKECLYKGIESAIPYCRVGDISNAIQKHAEKNKYSIIKELVGHGIGMDLHEDPQIPNYGEKNKGLILKPGSIIAIEPMITEGSSDIKLMNDNWTIITKDKRLSVHFEHTVFIDNNHVEILTDRNNIN